MTDQNKQTEEPVAPPMVDMEAQIKVLRETLMSELSKKYNGDLLPFINSLPFNKAVLQNVLHYFMTGLAWAEHIISREPIVINNSPMAQSGVKVEPPKLPSHAEALAASKAAKEEKSASDAAVEEPPASS